MYKTKYILNSSSKVTKIVKTLKKNFAITEEKQFKLKYFLYDSFDFLLLKNGLAVFQNSKELNLVNLQSDENIASFSNQEKTDIIQITSILDTEFRRILTEFVAPRVLIKKINVEEIRKLYNIVNKDEKTVLRLCVSEFLANGFEGKYIKLIPIRGYNSVFKKASQFVEQFEENLYFNTIAHTVLYAANINPDDYSSKFFVNFEGNESIHYALTKILDQSFKIIRKNYLGVIDDIDIEFLHQFRVNLRRSRSALSLLPEVYDEKFVKQFGNSLKKIADKTSRLRDLDVFIFDKDKLFNLIPNELAEGLEPLVGYFENERVDEFSKLHKYLSSSKYKQEFTKWEKTLIKNGKKIARGSRADENVKEYASEILLYEFNRIIKLGKMVKPKSNDEKFHDVRKECKKLRYLLEFFITLFEPTQMKIFIFSLKKLQDVLGVFNDVSVQRENLYNLLNSNIKIVKENRKLSAAIGGAISTLQNIQIEKRNQFFESFDNFSNKKNIKLAKELFGEN